MLSPTTQHRQRILVVDDCPMDRMLVSGLLKKTGRWVIDCAANGREALALGQKKLPDLVVSDLQMPEMNGLQLVREIKRQWPNLPVVLITGKGSEEIAIEALRGGAASYSPKSALAQDLCRTVQFVLGVSARKAVPLQASRLHTPYHHGFVLENDCKLIGPLLEHLQSQMPAWSENERLRISMALGEALVNAMHHGNLQVSSDLRTGDESLYHETIRERKVAAPYCARRVHVLARFDEELVEVTIEDEGPGFNPQSVPDPTVDANLEKLSGRGLLLMKSFMDQVDYNAAGNRITLIKRRNPANYGGVTNCGCGVEDE